MNLSFFHKLNPKSKRMTKNHYLFRSYTDVKWLIKMAEFCLIVEFAWEESGTCGATLSSILGKQVTFSIITFQLIVKPCQNSVESLNMCTEIPDRAIRQIINYQLLITNDSLTPNVRPCQKMLLSHLRFVAILT